MIIAYTYVPDIITESWLYQLQKQIPAQFLESVNLKKQREPLARSLAGRYLLSEILKLEKQPVDSLSILLDFYKRPYLVQSSCNFSIAHSGKLVVCACTHQNKIGIDIEKISSVNPEDFISQFTTTQLKQVLDTVSSPDLFYQLWTAKEAVSKAAGKGLYIDFKNIIFSDDGRCTLEDDHWLTGQLPISPGYCCTVASDVPISDYMLMRI